MWPKPLLWFPFLLVWAQLKSTYLCKCGWSVLHCTMTVCTATKRLMSLNVLFGSNDRAVYSCFAYYPVWLSSQWSVKRVCSSVWIERSVRRWPWASPGLQSAMALNTEDPSSRGPPWVKGPFHLRVSRQGCFGVGFLFRGLWRTLGAF